MDFSLGDERQMLTDSLGRFLASNFDWNTRETVVESDEGWSRGIWGRLTELGIIGALFSERSGGFGGSALDIGVVFGEVGRALAVGPFLGTLLAGRVLAACDRADLLEDAMSGRTILTAALDTLSATASPTQASWCIAGVQSVVPFAASADYLVVAARGPDGPSPFLVEAGARGMQVRDYPVVDGGRAGEVTFVETPAILLGQAGDVSAVLEEATAAGLVALAWEAVAIMDVLRDSTLEYLRTRRQFGIPIGKFQALQHRMATLALEIEQARSSAINAAARFEEGRVVRERAVSAAKFTVGRVGTLVAEEAIQMHGGIGMTWELPLSHYAKRLIMIGHQLGDEDHHLARFIALGV